MKTVLNLYMYELYKSKYLEENKDKIFIEDDLDLLIKDKYNSLYIYELYEEDNIESSSVIKYISDHGTLINIDGYEYNKEVISNILNKLSGNMMPINPSEIHIVNSELEQDNIKSIIVCVGNSRKSYRLNININNSNIIRKRKYKAIGLNMILIDRNELELEDDIITEMTLNYLADHDYCYTKRSKLNELTTNGLDKKFMRKWDKENIMVCANVDITNDFYCNGDCENCEYDCGDDEDYD